MDGGDVHAVGPERGGLIVDQRHQRRDDDGRPLRQDRRDLVAQRLARARRHHGERAGAGDEEIDDLALAGPEGLIAEDVVQHVERAAESLRCACRDCHFVLPHLSVPVHAP